MLNGSRLAFIAFVAQAVACGEPDVALSSAGRQNESPLAPPGAPDAPERTDARNDAVVVSVPHAPATPANTRPASGPFGLGEALAAGGEWSFAERVQGDGWLRFHFDAGSSTTGTVDYLPGVPAVGIFSCLATSAKFTVDPSARSVLLDFPAPCSDVLIEVSPESYGRGPIGARLVAGFMMTEVATGIVSTEGLATQFAGGHCDTAFQQCTY